MECAMSLVAKCLLVILFFVFCFLFLSFPTDLKNPITFFCGGELNSYGREEWIKALLPLGREKEEERELEEQAADHAGVQS